MGRAWIFVGLAALTGCVQSEVIECGDGRVCPIGSVCDNTHLLCVAQDQFDKCAGLDQNAPCSAAGVPDGLCHEGVCLAALCGDGVLTGDEVCDGTQFKESSCLALDYYDDVPLQCNDACGYDESVCTGFCGDGAINGPELCDGGDPVESCVDLGYAAGYLTCQQCGPGLDDCRFMGWQTSFAGSRNAGIHGSSDTDIYLVGQNSIQHWDGKQWKPIDVSACVPVGSNTDYTSVWAYANNAAFIAAVDKTAASSFALHLTGTTCTKTSIAALNSVKGIWASSATDAYAVGDNGLGIYHFNGSAWSQVDTTNTLAVWGSGPTDIYAGGAGAFLHSTGGAFTAVGGYTVSGSVISIWGENATNVFVSSAVTGGVPSSAVHRMNNGVAWTQIYTGIAGLRGYWAAGRVFAANTSRILSYDGRDWIDLAMPTDATAQMRATAYAVYASPLANVFAADLNTVERYRAAAWAEDDFAASGRLFARSGKQAVLAANNGADFLIFDGQLWNDDITAPAGVTDVWIDSASGDIFMIQDAGGVWRKAAGGIWPAQATVTQPGSLIYGLSATNLFLVTNDIPNSIATIRRWDGTPAGGLTCGTCTIPDVVIRIWGAASDEMYAITKNAHLYKFNGTSWSDVMPLAAKTFVLHGSATNDVYVGESDGSVMRWDGSTWTEVFKAAVSVVGLWAFAPDDVFVTTVGGRMYHYDGAHWYEVKTESFSQLSQLSGGGDVLFMVNQSQDVFRLIRSTKW